MCRNKRPSGRAPATHDGQSLVVLILREPEPAVFNWDLDPERADLGQAIEHLLRHPPVPVDGITINVLPGEFLQFLEERLGACLHFWIRLGEGMNEGEVQFPVIELASEAPILPFGFASGFRHLAGFLLGGEALLGVLRHRGPPRWGLAGVGSFLISICSKSNAETPRVFLELVRPSDPARRLRRSWFRIG